MYWLPIGIAFILSAIIGKPLGTDLVDTILVLLDMVFALILSVLIFKFTMSLDEFPLLYLASLLIPGLWFGGSVLTFGIQFITVTIALTMLISFLVSSVLFAKLVVKE